MPNDICLTKLLGKMFRKFHKLMEMLPDSIYKILKVSCFVDTLDIWKIVYAEQNSNAVRAIKTRYANAEIT